MTLVMVFDTETTGLPEKKASIKEHDKWPYITQLSFIVYNTYTNKVEKFYNNYIKLHNDIVINSDAEKITGITKDFLKDNGVDIKIVMHDFNISLRRCNLIIGHNLSFDKRLIMVECFRNNINQYFTCYYNSRIPVRKNEYCTMINSKNLNNNKYFKLVNLFKHLFDYTPENLHDSRVDILITLKIYIKLEYNKDINVLSSEFHNLFKEFMLCDNNISSSNNIISNNTACLND